MDRYSRTINALEWMNCCEYSQDQWIKYILCIKHYLGEDGREIAREWSASDPERFTEYAFKKAWEHSDGRNNGEGALFGEAKAKGWNPVAESKMTEAQRAAMEESRERAKARIKELEEEKAKKFQDALTAYAMADPATGKEGYLIDKRLELPPCCEGVKSNKDGSLLLPAKNRKGDTVGVQFITATGKKYIFGTQNYGFFVIGKLERDGKAWLCEGFATGLTGWWATNTPVIVCFTADNVKNVADSLRGDYELSVLADNDSEKTNKGLEVAIATELPYSMPCFEQYGAKSGDWDDLRQLSNIDVVRREINAQLKNSEEDLTLPVDVSKIDLLNPPDFVGELADWMESNGRTNTKRLCVMGALYSVGALGSLSHCDSDTGEPLKTNVYAFCIAPSGTGKDTVLEGVNEVFYISGMGDANQGETMSSQEIQRNLFDSQIGSYVIDEVGQELNLINKNGGHNAGMVKQFTAGFTKGDKRWGGRRTEFKTFLTARDKHIAKIRADLEEGYEGDEQINEEREIYLKALLEEFQYDNENYLTANSFNGVSLNMLGLSTPENFNKMVDHEKIQDGFFGRAFIAEEFNDNPRFKKGFRKTPMTEDMKMALKALTCGVETETRFSEIGIRAPKKRKPVGTSPEAAQLMEDISEYIQGLGERLRKHGTTPLSRRAYEMIDKVSLILSLCTSSSNTTVRYRTAEHVRWAFAFVLNDIRNKVEIATTNASVAFDDRSEAVVNVVLKTVKRGKDLAMSCAEIRNYSDNRKYGADEVKKALEELEMSAKIKVTKTKRGTKKYYK